MRCVPSLPLLRERVRAPLSLSRALPPMKHFPLPLENRFASAAPTPPILPALRACAVIADTFSRNLRRFSSPARYRPAGLVGVCRCAASHPACTCWRDIHAQEIGRHPPPIGSSSFQSGPPSPCTARQQR